MTQPGGVYTPYSTLRDLFPGAKPTWIAEEIDQERIMSYQLYEQIYWNVPDAFKLTWRGTADKPIYLPSAKSIVETLHRYITPNMSFYLKPTALGGATEQDIVVAQEYLEDFNTRERFSARMNTGKRYSLIRGDWLWYLQGDPDKLPGTRVSRTLLDPASYFPVFDPDDIDKITGIHIVDQYIPPGEKDLVIKRTTYRKPGYSTAFPDSQWITVSQAIFALDDWEGPKSKPKKVLRPETELAGIPTLPVYHIKNFEEPQNPFGSSEIRGFERIISALNQGISDEELTLALVGLGSYTTDAPRPTDDDGNEINWNLGPGKVVERPAGTTFEKLQGASSMAPMIDHLNFLKQWLREGSSTPDIAVGNVDVTVAESGVALALQLAPILDKSGEKDDLIVSTMDQMQYDLIKYWLPTYEKTTFDGMKMMSTVGDKLPVDRAQKLSELDNMLDRGVISTAYYRAEASKLGFTFPEGMQGEVLKEKAAFATAEDPFTVRANAELGANGANNGQTTNGQTTFQQ